MSVFRVGSNKSSVNNFPTVRPTLDLDFANSKTLDPRITFTRSSGGSYVGPDGLIKYAGVNEPRFDHNPSTGESLGLLMEQARQNLVVNSADFSSAFNVVGTTLSVVSDAATAPDGSSNADLVLESNATEIHYAISNFSVTGNASYSFSIFVKNFSGSRLLGLRLSNTAWTNRITAIFNPVTGEWSSSPSAFGTASGATGQIQALQNNWYRVTISGTPDPAASTVRVTIATSNSSTNSLPSYEGDGTSGIYIWGAQLEQGSFPTSYIPTQGSTRTRAADNVEMTGTNFSSWFNQSEGSIRLSYSIIGNNIDNTIFAINNTTQNEQIDSRWFTSGTGYRVRVGGVNQASYAEGDAPPIPNKKYFSSFGYKQNNFTMSINGSQVVTDTSGDLPTGLVRIEFGKRANTTRGNLTLSRFTYFPKRFPSQLLQALTR